MLESHIIKLKCSVTYFVSVVLILYPVPLCTAAFNDGNEEAKKDWVFQNYTFKRFEGLTQRGLHQSSHSGWAEQAK